MAEDTVSTTSEKKKRRRRLGDRNDGRRLRSITPMHRIQSYIMKVRADAQNEFADTLDVGKIDAYLARKKTEGYKNIGLLHVILAAYVRMLSQKPGCNRFIAGQKVFARNDITAVMAVKKEMSLNSPDTMIKCVFEPTDTVVDVYEKLNAIIVQNQGLDDESSFDTLAKVLNFTPGLLLRFLVGFLRFLDYFGLLPRALTKLSPFHGSIIITSMGSLGIPPIYHHLYDFGTLPVFFSYGKKYHKYELDREGNPVKKTYVDIKVVTDERICDGYYYASAFRTVKRYIENPDLLDTPPETVIEDID